MSVNTHLNEMHVFFFGISSFLFIDSQFSVAGAEVDPGQTGQWSIQEQHSLGEIRSCVDFPFKEWSVCCCRLILG